MPVTADTTLWTADTHCVTADGRIICIDAEVVEAAVAVDQFDAVADVAADALEAANAVDVLDAIAEAPGVFSANLIEAADALDQLDADIISVEVPIAAVGGRAYPRRPFPVEGVGFGILPELEGEARGVVGAVGRSAAQILVHAAAAGACGQAGNAAAALKGLSVASKGVVGTRGSGAGMIVKFSGSATGRHDDDEVAVITFLLAA